MPDLASLVIRVSTTGAEQAQSQLEGVERRARSTARGVDELSSSMGRGVKSIDNFQNDLLKFGRTLASIAAIFYTLKNAIQIVQAGFEFNRMVEDTNLALTGLLASLYKYRDAQGMIVRGADAFNKAQEDAIILQTDLRIAGLKTAATYQELMAAMQQAAAPAREAGVPLANMVQFVQRFVQIAQLAGIPMNQLNEEIRSFLTGTMQARMTRVKPLLEGLGFDNESIRQLQSSGKFFAEFMERTAILSILAERSVTTFTVSLSNLKDAFQNILGTGFEGAFTTLKVYMYDLTNWIVDIDEKSKTITFNPGFLSTIRAVDSAIVGVLDGIKNVLVYLSKFPETHPILTKIGAEFGSWIGNLAIVALYLRILFGVLQLILAIFKSIFVTTALLVGSKLVSWWTTLTAVVGGIIPVLLGAATEIAVFNSFGQAMTAATAAGIALNAAMTLLLPNLLLVAAALASFGAYKTLQGRTGATLYEEPWQYITEPKREEPFSPYRQQQGEFFKPYQRYLLGGVSGVGGMRGEPGDKMREWSQQAVEALQSVNSLAANMNRELGVASENRLSKIISQMAKMNDSIDKTIYKMKEHGETQKLAIVYEQQLLNIRNQIVSAELEQRNRDIYRYYLENMGEGLEIQLKKNLFKFEEFQKKFVTPPSEATLAELYGGPMAQLIMGAKTAGSEMEAAALKWGDAWRTQTDSIVSSIDKVIDKVKELANTPTTSTSTEGLQQAMQRYLGGATSYQEYLKAGMGLNYAFPTAPIQPNFKPTSQQIEEAILAATSKFPAVSAAMIRAIIQQESGGSPWAKSPKGAMGLMQLMPGTAQDLGVLNPYDIMQNIMGGTEYLNKLFSNYRDWGLALAAYNAGAGRVDKWIAGEKGLPEETLKYVPSILGMVGGIGKFRELQGVYDARLKEKMGMDPEQLNRMVLWRDHTKAISDNYVKIEDNLRGSYNTLAGMNIPFSEQVKYSAQALEKELGINTAKAEQFVLANNLAGAQRTQVLFLAGLINQEKVRENVIKLQTSAYQKQNEILGLFEKYGSAIAQNMPLPVEQLRVEEAILQVRQKMASNEFKTAMLNPNLTAEEREQLGILFNMSQEAEKFGLIRKKWMTEGAIGGLKEWSLARVAAGQTYEASSIIELMQSLEKGMSSSVAKGLIAKLKGEKVNFDELGWSLAESFINKAVEGILGQFWVAFAQVLMQWLGIEQIGQISNATQAAAILAGGGAQAGVNIVNSAIAAAEILARGGAQGGSSGSWLKDLGSKALGWLGGLFGFGSSSGGRGPYTAYSSQGLPLTVPSSSTWVPGSQHGNIFTSPSITRVSETGAPEGVFPLYRTSSGDLGVRVAGAGQGPTHINLSVINNTGIPVDAKANQRGDTIEVVLDKMMADGISRGSSKTYKALTQTFGLGPTTRGR